jgi:PAS domain S-box-containing protein
LRLTRSNLVPHRTARLELEVDLRRGREAEAELQHPYHSFEERIAQHANELARANEELEREMSRCRSAEARFSAISESVPYGAWVYNLDGTAIQVSQSYLELTGATSETAKHNPWFNLIHREDRKRVDDLWKVTVASGSVWDCEFRVQRADGEVRQLLSRGVPLDDPNSKVASYAGFQLDVTDRVKLRDELVRLKGELEAQVREKTEELREANRQLLLDLAERTKAELALRDSEGQLRAMFENALDAMVLMRSDRKILDANESALQLFEYSHSELQKLRWDDLLPPERLQGLEARWKAFLEGGTKRGEVDIKRRGGNSRLVAFSSRANILPGRHLITLKDITDQREAEDSLRMLSHRLIRLQDDERRRIARELHDSTGQCLAAMRMHLDAIAEAAPGLPQKAQKSLDNAVTICRSCTADVRTISYLLHPPLLDEVGLMPALEWYVSGFSERSGITVSKEILEPSQALSRELNTALFRIIQEALANIHKHADSKEAKIRLYGNNKLVILEISDSGKGIDPARLQNCRNGVKGLGVGITGMRERVRQLGGTLEIEPVSPGTLVRATLPIMEENYGNA